ncbi:aldehyde dehydrogenase family protein, partial [Pseudoalteromonas sp. SWN29]
TTVLKPSDTTPSATLLFAEIAAEFLPAGVFNVLTGDRTTGGLMIDHKTPQMVSITGSVRAGMEVAKAASVDLKRVHLELGGKAPVIVCDDADIESAVAGIGAAGYFNAGQDCTAATRVIVHERVHDEFVAALVAWTRDNATTGAPDEDVYFGAVNNANQCAQVSRVIE